MSARMRFLELAVDTERAHPMSSDMRSAIVTMETGASGGLVSTATDTCVATENLSATMAEPASK